MRSFTFEVLTVEHRFTGRRRRPEGGRWLDLARALARTGRVSLVMDYEMFGIPTFEDDGWTRRTYTVTELPGQFAA